MRQIEARFGSAVASLDIAIGHLYVLGDAYVSSKLPEEVKAARKRSLESKIEALKAVKISLNAGSTPWNEDDL